MLSLLPGRLRQTVASVQHGYWYSRSSEFFRQGLMQTLRWLRMPGYTLFAIGFVVFGSASASDTPSRRRARMSARMVEPSHERCRRPAPVADAPRLLDHFALIIVLALVVAAVRDPVPAVPMLLGFDALAAHGRGSIH